MKTSLTALGAMVLLLVAQQVSPAQQPMSVAAWGSGPSMTAESSPFSRGQCPGPGECFGGGCEAGCPDPFCIDRWAVFGDFLYLRPRNVDVAIGAPVTPTDAPDPPAIGPALVVDSRYRPGFRVGFARAIDECATIGLTYSHLDATQEINPAVDPETQTILPLVTHPSQLLPGSTFDTAFGRQRVGFRIADVEFRHVFRATDRYALAYSVGTRYTNLRQDLAAAFFAPVVGDDQNVFTRIRFDGAGIRLGLDGERCAADTCLLVYGKAAASFVAGDFRAQYVQVQPDQLPSVDASWEAGRVVSMLDLELGGGWASPDGRFRVTAGYLVSGWFNVVKNSSWIRAVQTNNFTGLSDTISFDGVVLRSEFRF